MFWSKDQQVRIQQIIRGLLITYTRREIGKVQNMGKINIHTMHDWKDAIHEALIDVRVHRQGDFKEKIECTLIVEHEFTYDELFPKFKQELYMHEFQLNTREKQIEVIDEVQALQVSSLLNLLSAPPSTLSL